MSSSLLGGMVGVVGAAGGVTLGGADAAVFAGAGLAGEGAGDAAGAAGDAVGAGGPPPIALGFVETPLQPDGSWRSPYALSPVIDTPLP